MVGPVVRAACGCAFHNTALCRPAADQCPTCPLRYDSIVRALCESRNALVERLVRELCGDDAPDDGGDDLDEEDDDEDDVVCVEEDAEAPRADPPVEITPALFALQLTAALSKWL